RNSLHDSLHSKLVSLEEFSAKLRAAKTAQIDPNFIVIARTEALIAGEGMDAAWRRATAYAEAGADMIVIHSRAADPNDIRNFGLLWNQDVPLVAIPTTYANVTVGELYGYGYKMAIFANQALRAAVRAMQHTLQSMFQTQTPSSAEAELTSLADIFALAGFEEVRELEKRFMQGTDEPQPQACPPQIPHVSDTP
ncbi:MAG: isocitrate lyase/phosphoenolpyruvate mutase family protein, partial [Planctomycetaceae bacterium]